MGNELTLLIILVVAATGSLLVLSVSVAALARRRSRSYLLVSLALSVLAVRTAVAGLTITNTVPVGIHHLLEHGLDVLMIALVVGAVYYARMVEKRAPMREYGRHD